MIFNKTQNGSSELYNLTGTFYKANDFAGIMEDIVLAEMDVVRQIGQSLFERAQKHYLSNDYNADPTTANENDMLVRRIQLPIAYQAILHYYQRNLVSHEDSGRKAKISEGEKMPWAWQLEKDDAVMRDTYYRMLDELYRFLEAGKIAEWESSQQYQNQQHSIIQSLADFEIIYPLDGSYYTFYTLMPFILEVQQRFVKPIAGDRYSTLISNTDSDIKNAAQRFIALKAMVVAVQRLSITVFPVGISQRFSDSFQGNTAGNKPSVDAFKFYLTALDRQADEALQHLHEVLSPSDPRDYQLLPNNDAKNKFFTTQ